MPPTTLAPGKVLLSLLTLFAFSYQLAAAQDVYKIWDAYHTSHDRSATFKPVHPRPALVFEKPGAIGSGHIVVTDTTTYQQVIGLGGSLTDSSSLLLSQLKCKNSTEYWSLLEYLFDATEGANAAGFSFLRVPIGASDFAATEYSFNDVANDTCFNNFSIDNAPDHIFEALRDIQIVNPNVKFHLVPWSPPGWMKTSGTMKGGSLKPEMVPYYANYLLKALQAFQSKGVTAYSITIQNEHSYENPTYPTATLSYADEARIGVVLKALMATSGFSKVKLIGNEDSWSEASGYAIQLMQAAGDAFDGVSFHCYGGQVKDQDVWHKAYPKKASVDVDIYFTECSGILNSDYWNDIKWYTENIFFGALENSAKSAAMWNIALDGSGEPRFPGTASCGSPGCRGIVTINPNNGTWTANQEFFAMAQVSKAIIPRDVGGPSGRRIKIAVKGDLAWTLRVVGFVTQRSNATEWQRYSLVVMNWNDSGKPTSVNTTILFRGVQTRYNFPLGLTTLWWYAPALNTTSIEHEIVAEYHAAQSILG